MTSNEFGTDFLNPPFLDAYGNVPVDASHPSVSQARQSEQERIDYLKHNSKINFQGIPMPVEVVYQFPAAESLRALNFVASHPEKAHRVDRRHCTPEDIRFSSN